MIIQEQFQYWWQKRYSTPVTMQDQTHIQKWVQQACLLLADYHSLEDCLEHQRIDCHLSQDPHVIAGVRMRAQLDLNLKQLTIYARALDELQVLHGCRKTIERVILSHEVFHLLCPNCPTRWQEAAAHWFSAKVTQLQEFPGIWDLSVK